MLIHKELSQDLPFSNGRLKSSTIKRSALTGSAPNRRWKFYVREKENLHYKSSRLEGKMDKKAYRISANIG